MPSLWEDVDYRPPSSPATMDQYLSTAGDLLLGRESVFSVLWATVGGLRLPGNIVSLQETAAGLVVVSCSDR